MPALRGLGILEGLSHLGLTPQAEQIPPCGRATAGEIVTATTPNPTTVGTDYLALIANQAKVQAATTAFETSVEGILTSAQLTKFQALVQAAGTITGSDALPGCPPADDSSSDS